MESCHKSSFTKTLENCGHPFLCFHFYFRFLSIFVKTALFWTRDIPDGVHSNLPGLLVCPSINSLVPWFVLKISETAHFLFMKFDVTKVKMWHGGNFEKNLDPGIKGDWMSKLELKKQLLKVSSFGKRQCSIWVWCHIWEKS